MRINDLRWLRLTVISIVVGLCAGSSVKANEHTQIAPASLPQDVKKLEAPGLHNLFVLSSNVFSGSAPDGEEGFVSLERLGVKTIITVDGTRPDVETAHKHGMRYVHLPHGYDGISTNTELLLAKAGRMLPGPIYVHCHHGKHRGPTAAAVICMADDGWTAAQAESWLVAAGTATNYPGLYETVREFDPPTAEELRAVSSKFPETARVSGLVDAMVDIDERWDHLKASLAAGFQAPEDHPDLDPANEAVILWENFREAQRLPEAAHRSKNFVDRLKSAETEAKEIERLLHHYEADPKPNLNRHLNKVFGTMTETCAACHKTYRNPAGIKARK